MNPIEYVVVRLATLSHKLDGFRGEVEIFKPVCLFLIENNPCEIILRVHVFPFEPLDVAPAQTCQARKQERPFDGRVMAFRLGEHPYLVYREVHSFPLFRFYALNAPYRVVRYYPLVVCLVTTGSQLVEIGNLTVPGKRSVLYTFPAIFRPCTCLVFEVVLEAQHKIMVDVFPF